MRSGYVTSPMEQELLEETDMGLTVFMGLIPELQLSDYDSTKCASIISPLSGGKELKFSIYLNTRWFYKDHNTGDAGDIFKYIARLKNLHRGKDIKQIIKIAKEVATNKNSAYKNGSEASDLTSEIIYASDYLSKTLLDRFFTKYGCDLANTLFIPKVIESATVYDNNGSAVHLGSDLKGNIDIFFGFYDMGTGVTLIYNPHRDVSYYHHKSGSIPNTYLFGWHEAIVYRNFHCPEVAVDLLLTNCVDNTLLLHSLGFPAVSVPELSDSVIGYLRDVVLPQCQNVLIFFDYSPLLSQATQKLSKAVGARVIELSEDMREHMEQIMDDSDGTYRILAYHLIDEEHIGEYLSDFMSYSTH